MKPQGFTLVEMVIVLIILGVLSAVAIPSYSDHLRKSARQEAKQLLLQAAVRQETQLLRTGAYAATMTALGYDADTVATGSGRYTVQVQSSSATGFVLAATPTGKGGQDDDPCGAFTVNHLGERGITTSATPAPTARSCWN